MLTLGLINAHVKEFSNYSVSVASQYSAAPSQFLTINNKLLRATILHIFRTLPRYSLASKTAVIAPPAQYTLLTNLLINSCHDPLGNYFHIAKRAHLHRPLAPVIPLETRHPLLSAHTRHPCIVLASVEQLRLTKLAAEGSLSNSHGLRTQIR